MDNTHDTDQGQPFADEIGNIPTPIGSAAGAIHARIEIERERIRGEEAIEAQLTTERKRLLVEGSDAEVDEVERRIDASRSAQVRILERVDLLRGQLIAANEAEESARLDEVAARAHRARILGEEIIGEYAKRAPELAALIERLAACDQIIEAANETLSRANRDKDMVSSPNAIRCRPRRRWMETIRKMVSFSEPGHPVFGKQYSRTSPSAPVQKVMCEGVEYDTHIEMDVEVEMTDYGDRPDALQDTVTLPAVGPAPDPNSGLVPLWDRGSNHRACASEAVVAEVRERIERDPNAIDAPAKRKKSADRGEA